MPAGLQWFSIETLLPVEDQDWFQDQPQASCLMKRDPVYRWKALQECASQSAKACFIVINSLMKEAQAISSPRSFPELSRVAPHLVRDQLLGTFERSTKHRLSNTLILPSSRACGRASGIVRL